MKKRILNVVWGEFPDIRLQKTGRLLGEAGHEVDVLCLVGGGGDWPWGEVIPARLPSNHLLRALWKVQRLIARDPAAIPQAFLAAYEAALRAKRYDVVQWNDLAGCVEAANVAKGAGLQIVLDMHENYADNMWSTERDLGKPSYMYNVNAWLAYEKRAVEAVDRVIVNIEEMGNRLIGMHGTAPERLDVVRNAEPPDLWSPVQEDPELVLRFAGRFVMLYVGSLSRHRGIDVILKALPLVQPRVPNLLFVVVGEGGGLATWRELAKSLRIEDMVVFEGRKPFSQAQRYYKCAHIGVIPHHQYSQTDNGIPHKLAQNFLSRVPVVVSSCHALERVVHETGAGAVFRAGHPASAAAAIIALADEQARLRAASAALSTAETGLLSWERMRSDLLDCYEKL